MMLYAIKKEISFTIIKKWYLCFLVLFMFSCQSDDDTSLPTEDLINGFWFVADKGYIFEFTDGKDIFYNINTAGCSIRDDDFIPVEFFGFTLTQVNENEIIGTSDLSDSDVIFTRLLDQNPNCLPNMISNTEDPKVNFDHFWNIFNDYYAFFETRNIDWSQYENLRAQVTTDNLYDTIEELAYLLEDGHVNIYDEAVGVDIRSGDPKLLERLNANLSGDLVLTNINDLFDLGNEKLVTIVTDYLGGDFEIDERENIIWGLINDDIGYINILTMEGYGTNFNDELPALNTLLDRVMEDVSTSGISKLILDLRFNDGGYDTAALNMVSRFMDQERVSYFKKARLGDGFTENKSFSVGPRGDFQFTGDIILLTSPFTISAGELFTLCMKDLPYVTIVGEHTNGAFSTVLEHVLPNGAKVGLSNEVYSDAQGEVFEVVGIGPTNQENQVPFLSTLDFQEEKDSGIDRAIELLQQ
ncbi:S41 family peptidase [Aquimarina sp. SS2-1]|uniref:S41 family peptidase n=1 Tax=Aquimarina besae TaxID=3342247 RepID=UPI00367124C2